MTPSPYDSKLDMVTATRTSVTYKDRETGATVTIWNTVPLVLSAKFAAVPDDGDAAQLIGYVKR